MTAGPLLPLSLEHGAVVLYRGKPHVVRQESSDFEMVVLSDEETGKLVEARIVDLSPAPSVRSASTKDLNEHAPETLEEAERKYTIIKLLLDLPDRTKKDVQAIADEHGLHYATVYRWIRHFEATGKLSVFVRRPRIDKGSSILPDETEKIISEIVEVFYLTKQQRKPAKIIREVLKVCARQGVKPPHPNTIRNRIKAIDGYRKTKARKGNKAARDAYAPIKGSFPAADVPLSVVQVDHTPVDIILVDDIHREPVGRPWLTLLIDVFSRVVLGFYISFDPPGNLSLGLCLSMAFLPKEKWLAKHDIETPWPCWGIPRTIHADNAKEFRGNMLRKACKEYGIDLEWRPVATPHYGAHVERLLGTLNDEIHGAPGSTFSNPKERGEYDSEKEAAMSLTEFERWFTILCIEIYHQRKHSALGIPPIAKWQEGILGTKKKPGIGLPPRVTDELRLKLDLMPFERRTVQPYGIVWDHVEYQHDVLRRWINAPDPESPGRKRKFLCRRDPRDISVIWFYDPEVEQYYAIPYRNTAHPAISIWELREAEKRAAEGHPEVRIDENMIFDAYDKMRLIEEEAKRITKKTRRKRERGRLGLNNAREHLDVNVSPTDLLKAQETQTTVRDIQPFEEFDDMRDEPDE